MNMRTHSLLLTTLSLLTPSCGQPEDMTEKDSMVESSTNTGATADTAEIASDTTLASEDASSHTDSVLTSVGNLDNASSTSLGLAENMGSEKKDESQEDRSCTAPAEDSADKSTVVTINREMQREKTLTKGNANISIQISRTHNITRTWSKTDTSGNQVVIPCAENSNHIKLAATDFAGVKMTAAFTRYNANMHTKTVGGEEKVFNRSHKAEGTRTVNWTDVSADDTQVTLTKTIALNISKTFTRLDKDGTDKQTTATITTAEGAPLTVKVTRNTTSRDWVKKVISGTVDAVYQDGGKSALTYSDATWTSEGECTPVSGTITGQITKSGETEASRTFTIDLSAETKTISFADGSTATFDLEGCGLQKAGKQVISNVKKGEGKTRGPVNRKKR